jgi:hypothetical protein
MFHWLGRQYAKRIVNINVNILLAGLLALAPTLLVVRLVEHLLRSGVVSGAKLHLGDKAIISGATLIADIFFDVTIYYALHWVANHSGVFSRLKMASVGARVQKRQARIEGIADAAVESVPFFKDATKVQFERMVLSPLLYFLFLGTQFVLMSVKHVPPVWATLIGFFVGIITARTLHTLWMLREERRRNRALALAEDRSSGHPTGAKGGAKDSSAAA